MTEICVSAQTFHQPAPQSTPNVAFRTRSRPYRSAQQARGTDGSTDAAPLSLDQRTNFDGRAASHPIPHRIKLISYPNGDAEMVATRYRKPRPREAGRPFDVDDDGVITERPAPPPKTPAQVVSDRTKSASRARTSLRRAVQAGSLDTLLTLTFRRNLTDIAVAWPIAVRFIRGMRDALGKFSYVIVPERQKRGAWHFHLALRGWQDLKLIRSCWKRAGGDGNVDVRPFKGPLHKLASYISKYIAKTFTDDELEKASHHRYRRSQDLTPVDYVQVCTFDPREANEAFQRLFKQAGVIGFAHVSSGDPSDYEYFVWGSTWEVSPPTPG